MSCVIVHLESTMQSHILSKINAQRVFVHLPNTFWSNATEMQVETALSEIFTSSSSDIRVLLPGSFNEFGIGAPDATLYLGSKKSDVERINESRRKLNMSELKFCSDLVLPAASREEEEEKEKMKKDEQNTYANVCLGGTFDRLHAGHKILLTKACLVATQRVVVGVTDYSNSPKLGSKTLSGFMQPVEIRSELVRHFMSSIAPHLIIETSPITDPFGPSIVDKNLQAIVVSKETARGGDAVRKKRLELGLCDIDVVEIGLVGTNTTKATSANQKLSSSGLRKDELAKFLRNPNRNGSKTAHGRHLALHWAPLSDLSTLPYCIALTGGIASGKSTAANFLSKHGKIPIVDCDKLGHKAYVKGTQCFENLVQVFQKSYGENIVDSSTGEVCRKTLGALVFSDPKKMMKLNEIVWPAIAALARDEMIGLKKAGHDLVVMEAAVLLQAGWDRTLCDEVWVVVVPVSVARERLMMRNKINEKDANKRIGSQMTNRERVKLADVVISNQGDLKNTQEQLVEAWNGMKSTRWNVAKSAFTSFTTTTTNTSTTMTLLQRWTALCRDLNVKVSNALVWWRKIRRHHCESHRYYHTTRHLEEMFRVAIELNEKNIISNDVTFAIFFHDIVYDPARKDNEIVSAQIFRDFIRMCVPSFLGTERVAEWIERTATHHGDGHEVKGDLAIFLDADLSVLGSSASRYAEYAESIRMEYANVPWSAFQSGRIAVLKRFLDVRPSLYFTDRARELMEASARSNIQGEIQRLRSGLVVADSKI